jgi:hypothetical protein
MPVHDWTRVPDGTFHHFHVAWISLLADALNRSLLPSGYYAMAEQVAGIIPEVLTLQAIDDVSEDEVEDQTNGNGGVLVAASPPKTSVIARLQLEQSIYAAKANRLAIRHQSHDRVVAILEVISAGNKSSNAAFEQFLKNADAALWEGIHLLVIDLHPPTRRDPDGIHGAIWESLGGDEPYKRPAHKPLTLASYSAYSLGYPIQAFVEPIAVADVLQPMPLFLTSGRYINVPLEPSYMDAVSRVPDRARKPLET